MASLWTGARPQPRGRPRGTAQDVTAQDVTAQDVTAQDVGAPSSVASEGHRGFFVAPTLAGTLLLLLLIVLPGSLGWREPAAAVAAVVVAAGLGVLAVLAVAAAPAGQLVWLTRAASVLTSTAVLVALAEAGTDELALSLLFWFPWAGGQVGLAWSRPPVVLAHAGMLAAALLGVLSLQGRLGDHPYPGAAGALGVLAAAVCSFLASRWGWAHSRTDPLTGVASRSGLLLTGESLVADQLATGHETVLMVVDLDHFAEINTAFGYQAGDEVLRRFARRLRRVEPAPLAVARIDGDTFALFLPGRAVSGTDPVGSAPPEEVDPTLTDLGQAVLRRLDGRIRVGGVDVEVEATAGIATAPSCGGRIIDLLACAEAALTAARRASERVGVWTSRLAAVRPWELELQAQLRSAIDEGELELHYQPMRAAATGRVVGVEALMRWRHPARGLLPPGSFLPMAERSSLIVELTWWALDEALRQCGRWKAEGLRIPVSINLSPRLLVVDEFPRVVAERLAAHALPPDVLTLEITENALVSQPARAAAILDELRISGVKLSMDDFGTGYNSMEILKSLTLDEIKIDKGFVCDADGSLPDVAIVRSVVDLGHRLGLRVVGEGVETDSSARILTELGCDVLQGNGFSPARPAGELAPLLAGGPARPLGRADHPAGSDSRSAPPPSRRRPAEGSSASRSA